jgi:hypothetical protein
LKYLPINSGAFGEILEKSVATHNFVVKVQKRNINREEIEDVIREVAITKLCSVLAIGPASKRAFPSML